MNDELIILGEQKTPQLSLRKKLVGLDEGLNVYGMMDKDEEDILIPFTVSLFITSEKSKILLRKYVGDLRNGVCRESLGINFGQMSRQAYWLGKFVKLKRDMEAMGVVPMKAHGFECTIMGFRPETTVELYRAIEANLKEIAVLVGEVDSLLLAAPFTLYGNFYRYQKSLYDPQPVAKAHGYWKREVGGLTYNLLKDRQVFVVTDFLKKKILRHTSAPSVGEIGEVDFEAIRRHLTKDCWDNLPDEFQKCCARFHRFISWEGGILRLNHDLWGNYLFQFFHQLTPAERQAFVEIDLMLELVHEDIQHLPKAETNPAEFSRICNSAASNGALDLWSLATEGTQEFEIRNSQPSNYKFDGTALDTPLSALFREKCHEELKTVIDLWRPHLKDVDSAQDALCLSTFHFDLDQIQPSTVYLDFARLISQGALMVPMSNLAAYMFSHSNLSKSKNALYVQMKRYKKMCEQTRKKGKKRK